MKRICMIPARLGSTRVKNKNLRLINNKPLIAYIIESAIKANVFDEIYINSEADIFEKIANDYNVRFYKRPVDLASNSATNDDFALDFIQHVESDILIQLLPTSPFISPETIRNFCSQMNGQSFETMISVTNVQIESLYNGNAINFDKEKKTPPSQDLEPIKAYACGIMGWTTTSFKQNMDQFNSAYHGGNGRTGYYTVKGFETIDIDNEEDFLIAEVVSKALQHPSVEPKYYGDDDLIYDAERERILIEDGVANNSMFDFNKEVTKVEDIIRSNSSTESWSHTVINSKSNCATLIAQMPGEGNRLHFHHDWDEWWYIIQGEWEWFVEGKAITVKKGDIVFIERFKKHKITAIGNEMAIRLAVSREDVDHVYTDEHYSQILSTT